MYFSSSIWKNTTTLFQLAIKTQQATQFWHNLHFSICETQFLFVNHESCSLSKMQNTVDCLGWEMQHTYYCIQRMARTGQVESGTEFFYQIWTLRSISPVKQGCYYISINHLSKETITGRSLNITVAFIWRSMLGYISKQNKTKNQPESDSM